jgi:hypothetical protein
MKILTMKRPGLLVSLLALVLFSCTDKDAAALRTTNGPLEGNWRMIAVKNNSTGFIHTKPGAITGDVDITFVSVSSGKGFINGKTPTNTLNGDYTLDLTNKIDIGPLMASKVAETSWGLDFLYSVEKADTYTFEENGRLNIHTEKKTLFFERN